MIIKSKRIYMEDGLKDGFLVINDGKIQGFSNACEGEYTDYGDLRIIPGIFDTHNHGAFGYSLMAGNLAEENESNVRGFLKGIASQGVTSVLPTAKDDLFETCAKLAETGADGAEIVGIHSEGPWLNRVGEKGIWTSWPEVSLDRAKKMVSDGKGLLKLVALAPEIEGIDPIIEYFLSQGVNVAFAHSDDNYKQAMEAYDKKGLTVATHTGNVMTGLHHRDIGGLGASLFNDNVECEVICDGMHICLDMLKIFFKLKDYSRFMMVSDCTPLSGAPVGRYAGFMPKTNINVTAEGFVLSDEGRLCGSSQPVLFGIGNLVEKLSIPMETVIKMSSLNPSKKYGTAEKKGSLALGKDADFVVITDDYKAVCTYVRGKKVYDRDTDTVLFNPDFVKAIS